MKRFDKILRIITLISGIFTIFCYGTYLAISIIERSSFAGLIIPIAVIALACIPIFLHKKLPRWIKTVFCTGMCIYMITFIFFCTNVMSYSYDGTIEAIADESYGGAEGENMLVMVFGCRTYESPSKSLSLRLNSALEVLEKYPEALCVVSGGQGENEPRTEASSMKEYLVSHGISAERIYEEDKSSSTVLNIEYTNELIKKTPALSGRYLVGISSDFHLPRISILLNRADGLFSLIGAPSPRIEILFSNLVREYMAYIKMVLFHL